VGGQNVKLHGGAGTAQGKRLLNMGCGRTFHPDWLNVDFDDHGGAVLPYDLRLGIPFADAAFDVVYHSHLLEHFSRSEGEHFLNECFRVLRPGGLLRLAVPDLENIVRAYLACLEDTKAGMEGAEDRHEWMLVELLDQMTRREPGGEMGALWRRDSLPQEEFIRSRVGREFTDYRASREKHLNRAPDAVPPLPGFNASFMQSGEAHRWMYDECSLRRLLAAAGFENIAEQSHGTSLCPGLLAYELDTLPDGTVRKPDSLFMEAVRPATRAAVSKAKIRIAMFSTSDTGGAGIAAVRLHRSLPGAGVSSLMYVALQKTRAENLYVFPAWKQTVGRANDGSAVFAGLRNAARKREMQIARYSARPAGLEFFSTPDGCVGLNTLLFREDFDILHLHWIADFLDTDAFSSLQDRPLVWTLHDMRPFTGGCHYAGACDKFTEHCGACPQLGSDDPQDLSFLTWRRSMAAFRKLNLHVVTPSEWLAEQARRSSLFRNCPVRVIKPAQPLDIFRPMNKKEIRGSMGFRDNDLVLAFSAQSLDNDRKGVRFLPECLARLAASPLRDKLFLLLLGNSPPEALFHTGIRTGTLGHVDGAEQTALVYNAADAVLVTSLEDNAPNVICEAAGCGVPVIAFAAGGIPEMVKHRETGRLAPVGDVEALADGVRWLDAVRHDRALSLRCRAFALEQWNPAARAAEYAALYRDVLRGKGKEETCSLSLAGGDDLDEQHMFDAGYR
jgi:glycosyltransferase involved in cell wall biosynthesis/SAM-dependent methyltransferase